MSKRKIAQLEAQIAQAKTMLHDARRAINVALWSLGEPAVPLYPPAMQPRRTKRKAKR